MKRRQEITSLERDKLAYWFAVGKIIREIARLLKRSPSSICEELKRNNVALQGPLIAIGTRERDPAAILAGSGAGCRASITPLPPAVELRGRQSDAARTAPSQSASFSGRAPRSTLTGADHLLVVEQLVLSRAALPVDAHRRLDKALLSLPALPLRSGETLAFIGRCLTDGAAEPQPADAAPDRSDVSMPGSWNSARPAGRRRIDALLVQVEIAAAGA